MITGIHHVALSTSNIDRTIAFYRDVFGFEVVLEGGWERGTPETDAIVGLKDSAAKMAMLRAGNCFVEVFEYSSPTPRPGDPNRPAADHGYTHFCLTVTDIDAEYKRLTEAGMRFHSAPVQRPGRPYRATYGRDPEGNIVEILEILDPAHPFAMANARKP